MEIANIHVNEVMKDTTLTVRVNVKGIRQYTVRLWLAERLFHLAGWVLRTNIEVTD